uniref:Tumor necrosis factor receptor superfamily, member 21 n=1 Tax=Neogobius melanostomus TaxID=47308 RepID=A0A8C6WEE8_9GOBI
QATLLIVYYLLYPSVPSTHKYQHIDPSSGSHMTCDKCPAGTFVSSHCSPSSYTRGENGIEQCHRCREPCPAELVEKTPCSAILDRVCSCPAGTFLSEGVRCKPHSQCPPGTRVKRRGSETEDVLCKPCGKGTFSEGNTSAVRCRTHQDCQAQGLVLITPGARERDNVCGPPSSHPIIGTSSITPRVKRLRKRLCTFTSFGCHFQYYQGGWHHRFQTMSIVYLQVMSLSAKFPKWGLGPLGGKMGVARAHFLQFGFTKI